MDPNTGVRASSGAQVWVPLRPTRSMVSNKVCSLEYDINLKTDSTGSDKSHQYFVVAPGTVKLKAHALNKSGKKISSNEITIKITIPDSMNGVYYASALNGLDQNLQNSLLMTDSPFPTGFSGTTITLSNLEEELDPISYTRTVGYTEETTAPTEQSITTDSSSAYIPLGFRIKSDGITIGALLNQITFITKNS